MTWQPIELTRKPVGKGIVVYKKETGSEIYVSKQLREQLDVLDFRYCNFYRDGHRIMIQFTQQKLEGKSKKITDGKLSIPRKILEPYWVGWGVRGIEPHPDNGNLVIDLRDLGAADDRKTN